MSGDDTKSFVEDAKADYQEVVVGLNGSGTDSDGVQKPQDNSWIPVQDDPNPRSPKRRRMSPAQDDNEVDFEAAAARALAISLGVDHTSISPTPVPPQTAHNGSNGMLLSAHHASASSDIQARIDGLSTLDDLAGRILSTLAKMNHLEIGEMLFKLPPSQRAQDFRALKTDFEQAKRIYLVHPPFITPNVLGLKETEHIDVLRKANMATFMASIFSGEIGLRIMDINFLDVFVPEGGKLLKAQASIYLELKTQAFIAAKRTAPAILNQVMVDLFPSDMDKHLVTKRPGAKSLAPSELDFLKRLASRRDILYADMRNKKLDNLELRYRWDDFSREVNSYLSKNYDQAVTTSRDKCEQASPIPVREQLAQDQMEGQFSLASQQPQPTPSTAPIISTESDGDFNIDDFMAQAARAAEIALQGGSGVGYPSIQAERTILSGSPLLPPAPPPPAMTPTTQTEIPSHVTRTQISPPPPTAKQRDVQENTSSLHAEFQQYKPITAPSTTPAGESSVEEARGDVPHRSQTAPTQVLYERARLVTTNKASPFSRRPNPPSHRRPWTNEEENALMTGLDLVKGPHWSQILAMYGPGGTVNESLKDRNQVQLKDKARNLKLFFLKAGIEVPYYLQAVTGDLKTRAPAQAEKREAKERERTNTDDDDGLAANDELQIDMADDLEVPGQSATDHEEAQVATPAPDQAATEQTDATEDTPDKDEDHEEFDMEAMIARAAASVTQSLDNPLQ